jgi:hypothetical protein
MRARANAIVNGSEMKVERRGAACPQALADALAVHHACMVRQVR